MNLDLNRGDGEYRPYKSKRRDCNKSICMWELMSQGNEFLTKELIDKQCKCDSMDNCKAICGLLKAGRVEEAKSYL